MKKIKYLVVMLMIFCAGTIQAQTGELNRFSIESLDQKNQVRLFPNPSTDFLRITIKNTDLKEVSISVHNIIGNKVEARIDKTGDHEYTVKVDDLASGYYLLAIRDKNGYFKETHKFVVKH